MIDDVTDKERFIGAYITAALWSSTDSSDVPFDDAGYTRENIDVNSRIRIGNDCDWFIAENIDDLRDIDAEQAGHDFWLTRNGHGAGFWDRGLGEVGDRLSDAAHRFGEVYVVEYGTGLLEVR